MTDTTLTVRVPTSMLQLGLSEDEIQRRVTEWLVLSLFSENRITSGKAARLLHLTRTEFLSLLRARGLAYINYTPEEMAEELAAVKALSVTVDR